MRKSQNLPLTRVSTEFPASVSADSVLTVSRAMKLGPGTQTLRSPKCLYAQRTSIMFVCTKNVYHVYMHKEHLSNNDLYLLASGNDAQRTSIKQ